MLLYLCKTDIALRWWGHGKNYSEWIIIFTSNKQVKRRET